MVILSLDRQGKSEPNRDVLSGSIWRRCRIMIAVVRTRGTMIESTSALVIIWYSLISSSATFDKFNVCFQIISARLRPTKYKWMRTSYIHLKIDFNIQLLSFPLVTRHLSKHWGNPGLSRPLNIFVNKPLSPSIVTGTPKLSDKYLKYNQPKSWTLSLWSQQLLLSQYLYLLLLALLHRSQTRISHRLTGLLNLTQLMLRIHLRCLPSRRIVEASNIFWKLFLFSGKLNMVRLHRWRAKWLWNTAPYDHKWPLPKMNIECMVCVLVLSPSPGRYISATRQSSSSLSAEYVTMICV